MAKAVAGDDGGSIVCSDDPLLIVRMGRAFGGTDESCAHLDARRSQSQGRRQPPPVGDPASGDDGQVHGIHHLGHQGHCRNVTDMAARLHSLGDERIHSQARHPPGQGNRGHHRDNADARPLQWPQVGPCVSAADGHY